MRALLRAEWPVASATVSDALNGEEVITSGVAGAVVINDCGGVSLVVDWKSDVNPSTETINGYRGQLLAYLSALGATAGLLVFLTSGSTIEVRRADA